VFRPAHRAVVVAATVAPVFEPHRVVHRTALLASGLDSRDITELVRSGAIVRLWRGWYTTGPVIGLPDPRGVTRSMRVVLSHQSAVAWWGADLPEPPDRLHVTAPRNRGRLADPAPGIRLHRAVLADDEVTRHRGVRVTTPLRTALDIARCLPLDDATIVADALARRKLITKADLIRAADALAVGRGRPAARTVASQVDEGSGSVFESKTRLLMRRAGIPIPVTQYVVRHRGRWIGRVDFAWPELRVVVECDGYEFHSERDAFERDRQRWNALTTAGWRVVLVTWRQVAEQPEEVVDLVASALATARISTQLRQYGVRPGRM
jgi:hypothetical protein